MDLSNLSMILADAAPAAPTEGSSVNAQIKGLLPLLFLPVIFYLALIRPQQKRAKETAEMLKTVKSGDKIVTTGGIMGVVITVKEKSVTIRSADTKMEITKSAIGEISERSGESSES